MSGFVLLDTPIDTTQLRARLADQQCGGYAAFEGWVRNHNDGRAVEALKYEAYTPLAIAEGARVLQEAMERFEINQVACAHRIGALEIGELAVWVGVSAPHRGDAFRACRYVIDEIKQRLPIWKKEHYTDGTSEWINCSACAASSHESSG